jgi:hypothetical protein
VGLSMPGPSSLNDPIGESPIRMCSVAAPVGDLRRARHALRAIVVDTAHARWSDHLNVIR